MVQTLLLLNAMRRHLSAIGLFLGGYVLCLGTLHADIKVKTDYDKAFDFKQPKTWGWNDTGAGKVVMARWANENPEELRGRAEPVIKEAVAAEFARLKLQPATTGTPDLKITYHLLITLGSFGPDDGAVRALGGAMGPAPVRRRHAIAAWFRAGIARPGHRRRRPNGLAWVSRRRKSNPR